jgi:glycosyltransferase involved in cell wall biosynthesis
MMVEMGIPREKILTFPMSVPTESFGSEGDVPAGWDQKAVAFSNRSLYPLYNVETLVRAAPLIFEKARHAEVVIAGEGPERERLESLANELGVADRVKFIGAIPHERMPHYLRGSAVYVSTALSDGASVSLLEAMACGAFPVVADIPANREWIEDGGNGFLFPPENPEALAEKVLESFDRDDLRVSARDVNAHIIEQRAQWSSNIEKLLALFEQVMNRR